MLLSSLDSLIHNISIFEQLKVIRSSSMWATRLLMLRQATTLPRQKEGLFTSEIILDLLFFIISSPSSCRETVPTDSSPAMSYLFLLYIFSVKLRDINNVPDLFKWIPLLFRWLDLIFECSINGQWFCSQACFKYRFTSIALAAKRLSSVRDIIL